MTSWRDRFNRLSGKTRLVVCRLFVHLAGEEVAPLLGVLNRTARQAMDAEGDLDVLGKGLDEVCQSLIEYDVYWQSAANEGDVFWDESEADDYVTDLFTDSAQRYGVHLESAGSSNPEESFSLPVTRNVIVIIVAAYEGEVPALESDLANISALKAGLKALINLHYEERLRAIQLHFCPARLGDELTSEQILLNFPELIPL